MHRVLAELSGLLTHAIQDALRGQRCEPMLLQRVAIHPPTPPRGP